MSNRGLADSPFFNDQKTQRNLSRHLDSKLICNQIDLVKDIKWKIREFGREASTYRLSLEEKNSIIEVIYDFRKKKVRISENDVIRIAIRFLIYDHCLKKEKSLLTRVVG